MPIPKCCFPDCTNSRSKMNTLPGSRQVSFHRFPKNPDIRAKWKMSCKKPSDWDADQFLVCSDHFIDSDFEDDLKTRLLGSDRPRLLKSDAVPEHRVSEESLSPSDRLLKKTLEQKARKLLVESLLKDHELEQEALAMEIDEAITEDVDDLDRSKFESDSDTKSNCGEKKNRPTLMTTSGGVTIHHPQLDSILGTITPVIKAKANDPGSPSSGHEAASSHCSGDVKSLPVELDSQELFNLCQTLEKENVGLRKTIALLQNKLIDKDKKLNKIRKGLNIQLSNIFTKFAYDLERKYPSIPKPALRKMSRQKLTIKLKYQTK